MTSPRATRKRSRWQYVRLTPFDTSTTEGRAAERYRAATLGALANVASRIASMLALVLAIYLATPVLGPERFGIWAMFAALAAALSFLDLGVGNALINRVAHAQAGSEAELLRSLVTAGVGWLCVVGLASAVLLLTLNLLVPWGRVLHLSSPQIEAEARFAGYAFASIFGMHLLSSGALKILIGQQKSYESHLLAMAGALMALLVLWLTTDSNTTVAALLLKTFGAPTLIGLSALALLKARGLIDLPSIRRHMSTHGPSLLRTGSLFLVLQIATMAGWGLDALILGAVAGATAVAAFAITQRLFQFASQPIAVFLTPLWAAYADAVAKQDGNFVRTTLAKSMAASAVASVALTLPLALLGPYLVEYWTRGTVQVATSLLVAMAFWTVLEIVGTAFATYLNGAGIVRQQVVVSMIFCCIALPLKLVATQYFGATGIVTATSLIYVLVVVGLYATVFRKSVLEPLRGKTP